jgi:hypothetical protein
MPILSSKKDLEAIERILTTFKCGALGLNEHFPRAILYGPTMLGGLALPTVITRTTTTRINYFLYHIRLETPVGKKLDASRTFLQFEVGIFEQVLTAPFMTYGHLGTQSLIKTIWAETEPNNLTLRATEECAWHPRPMGTNDVAIMSIAVKHYSKSDTQKINRCRLYLQLFSIYDIITYAGPQIHPDILMGKCVESRTSLYYWVDFKRPPKRFFQTWKEFLLNYVTPILQNTDLHWYTNQSPNYRSTFQYSSYTNRLYQKIESGYLQNQLQPIIEQKISKKPHHSCN